MLTKLWCFLFGHKFIAKGFTGNVVESDNGLGMPIKSAMYRWEAQKWCLRCGCKNPHIVEPKSK